VVACADRRVGRVYENAMLTLERKDGTVTISERRRAEPVMIVSVPFLALAAFSLSTPGPLTAVRVACSLVMAGAALMCFQIGRSRVRPAPIRFDDADHLELASAESMDGYRVDLVRRDESRTCVLARSEPAGVLADALALSTELGVPLRPGWGLDEEALALLRDSSATDPHLAERTIDEHGPLPDQRIGATTALWATLFVPGATLVLIVSPARPDEPPTTLALVLPLLTAVISGVIAAVLFGLRQRATIRGGRLETTRTWFGRPLRASSPVEGVRGVFGVATDGGAAEHLLVATSTGLVAIPTDRVVILQRSLNSGPARDAGRAAQ